MTAIVLLGSVFLPAATMRPLAEALAGVADHVETVTPEDASSVAEVGRAYAEACRRYEAAVVVAHSNAGNYVPRLCLDSSLAGVVFIDAVLPPLDGGRWDVVPEGLRDHLTTMTDGDRLPPWTRWWPPEAVRPLFPDDGSFHRIDALAPRIPTSYLAGAMSAPSGWAEGLLAAYLAFGDTYAAEADRAGAAGWPVTTLDLGHLGMLHQPLRVAKAIRALLGRLGVLDGVAPPRAAESVEIVLRPLLAEDAEVLASWADDEEFCRHAGWTVRSVGAVREYWAAFIADPPPGLLRLVATRAGELVGYVDLHGDDPDERELGFLVGPSRRWGQGLGGEVAAAALEYAFGTLGLEAVWAEAVEANVASVQILRSLGMEKVGVGEAETFLGRESRYLRFRIQRVA